MYPLRGLVPLGPLQPLQCLSKTFSMVLFILKQQTQEQHLKITLIYIIYIIPLNIAIFILYNFSDMTSLIVCFVRRNLKKMVNI